jgi:hypothetical protein
MGIHEGSDELPTHNYSVSHYLTIQTTTLEDCDDSEFPTDDELDDVVDQLNKYWNNGESTFHWIDKDELWAWAEAREIDRVSPDFRTVLIVCDMNKEHATAEDGSPLKWIRALSGQSHMGDVRRYIESVDRALCDINMAVRCSQSDNLNFIDSAELKSVPHDETPLWQEFLMERDEWLDNQ